MKKKLFILPVIALLALVCAGCAAGTDAKGEEEQTDLGQLQEVAFDATYDGQTVEVIYWSSLSNPMLLQALNGNLPKSWTQIW